MKTQFTIQVDIDTDNPYPFDSTHTEHHPDGTFRVLIRSSESSNKHGLLPCVLHEFGHVLAQSLGLPAATADVRMQYGTPGDGKTIYDAEVEAWDIGEKLHIARCEALKTYELVRDIGRVVAIGPAIFKL